jgi:Zn-finger protein
MLPKFLLADNSLEMPDMIYVVHNENPRFIVESDIEDFWTNQEIHWIDEAPADEEVINQLLEEAEDFLESELENQDEYFEDGEDE